MRRALPCAALVIIVLLAIPFLSSGGAAAAKRPAPPGGFVDSIRFTQQPNQAQALLDLKNGAIDIYTFALRSGADIHTAHTDPALRAVDPLGGEVNLFVNPVPVDQGQAPGVFNPFAIREVREALNYLVDRNYLNALVYDGNGSPHAALWNDASPEVARDPFFFRDVNEGAGYDFDRGKSMIFDALTAAGATYDGTWKWQGNPIVVPFVIRVEDIRRPLGDYVADQVERVGLSVNRQYMTAGGAFSIVYNGPPDTGIWMLYTEGWAAVQIERWPDSDLSFYHCGSEGSAIWFYYAPPAALQDACARLLNGQFSSEAERQQLIETGTSLALSESVRVWLLADQPQVYSARVKALVVDSVGGVWSPFTMRTARFASPGGTLGVGQRLQFLSAFQPWQGFGWLYDLLIGQTIMDPGLAKHPRTGVYIPIRSEFETTTAGRDGTLNVPSSALAWDPTTMGFAPVAPGTTSKSKVTFHYTFGTWHDGAAMSMDDVLYSIALTARRDRGDVAAHDFDAANPHDRLFASTFRGLQVIDPTTLDLYIDYWHLDPSYIAATADAWPATPWEVGELAMATTLHDHTRVSELSAAIDGLDPIDLATGPAIGSMDNELASGNITTSGAGVTRPPGLDPYITQSEAEGRWSALLAWRTARGHYFVSNGPYVLGSPDPSTNQVTVQRFAAYPFPATRWDGLLSPPVPDLTIDDVETVTPGEESSVSLFTTVRGGPYDPATVLYRIRPADGTSTLLSGQAVLLGRGEWQVALSAEFTATLTPGTYLFEAAAIGSETSVVVFADQTFEVSSQDRDAMALSPAMEGLPASWRSTARLQV